MATGNTATGGHAETGFTPAPSAMSFEAATVEATGASSVERGQCAWLRRGLLDAGAYRPLDPASVWNSVSPELRVVSLAAYGMELSKTTAALLPAQRGRDRPLDTVCLAQDKKSGTTWAQPLFLLTKMGSRWSVPSSEPGHLGDTRPRCERAFNTTSGSIQLARCWSHLADAKSA